MDAKDFGDLIAGFAPEGPLRTLVYVVYGVCPAIALVIYKYYLGLLAKGGAPEGSIERQDYDRLRAKLKEGNWGARLYAKWLTAVLDWTGRFFGDAGKESKTPFLPPLFRLKYPAPLWTAPALDRCLLLALIYPVATIFLIWAISGHAGPAEAALGLEADRSGWERGLTVAAIGVLSFALWHFRWTGRWKSRRLSAFAAFSAAAAVFAGAGTIAFASAVFVSAVAFAVAFADAFAVAFAVTFAVTLALAVTIRVAVAVAFAGALAGAFALAGAVVGITTFAILLFFVNKSAVDHGWQGRFLTVFLPVMSVACLTAAPFLAPLPAWDRSGPLLLFLGLLTLLNAPFDWASLGLTRALLRRGLELGGWWPYVLALLDACLAAFIIVVLALTMVIGVQAFDKLAVHAGGEKAAVLPLDALFDGIAKSPAAPEYWWIYALLLSTMIPSLVNLAIGGMAFTRGIPGLGRRLLNWIPEGRDVPDYKRQLAAIFVTAQMFGGAILGGLVQVSLAGVLLAYAMPAIGLNLLGFARAVAAFDLPGQAGRFLASIR
ncbi:MAG: hypothetical protein L0Y60_04690 [Beijerinckiaceae bacterium]|nr:hypothetical protein [Beijerinckiaceae bacterium]